MASAGSLQQGLAAARGLLRGLSRSAPDWRVITWPQCAGASMGGMLHEAVDGPIRAI
jgi:hypothetical protein